MALIPAGDRRNLLGPESPAPRKENEMGRSEFDAHAALAERRTAWRATQAPRRRWPVAGAVRWLVAAVAALVAMSWLGVL